jgi:hypothetical protein
MKTVGPARVALYGNTAIVTARKTSTGAWEGAEYAADEWISEVYVQKDGRWMCVLSHKATAEG